jgi:selenide,water dikinase
MLPSIQAAREWTGAGHEVTLVNSGRFLYYSGMVPEYLGGVYRAEDVRIDLQALCTAANVRFVDAPATALDARRQRIQAGGTWLPYDLAALDIGAVPPGRPHAAIPTKPLHGLQALDASMQAVFHDARTTRHLLMVGAGAAGVELSLNLSARLHRAGKASQMKLTIVDQAERVLPRFPVGASRYVARLLRQRGVRLHLGTTVSPPQPDEGALRVALSGPAEDLVVDDVVWATGAAAPPLLQESDLPCTANGFVRVDRQLRVHGHPALFAAGDCAKVDGYADLARIGVHAVKQGPVLRDNITHALRDRAGTARKTFKPYAVAPLILSTGTPRGLWIAGPLWVAGTPMLRLKHYVDRSWIQSYQPSDTVANGIDLWDARAPLPKALPSTGSGAAVST